MPSQILQTLAAAALSWCFVVALLPVPLAQAQTSPRVAIVIGNSAYTILPSHATGAEDARDVALVLRARGYDVIEAVNQTRDELRSSAQLFLTRVAASEHAIVFYSGHSVGRDRDTIPLSTDATTIDDQVLADILGARALGIRLQREGRSALVLVDGCQRDISLDDRAREPCLDPDLVLNGPARLVMAMAGPAPGGLSATKGRNGFFTAALLRQLADPGKDFPQAIDDARLDVLALTKDQQIPWVKIGTAVPGTTLQPLQPTLPRGSTTPATIPLNPPQPVATSVPPAARPTHAPRPRAANEVCDTARNTHIYCATSVLPPQQGNSYRPASLFDDKADNAWVEGVAGDGIGEGFTVDLRGVRRVTGFAIRNGYTKSPETFVRNGRVKTATLVFSTGERRDITLKDTLDVQTFRFEAAIEATWVQFVINTVSKGSRNQDTAITSFNLTLQ